MTRSAFLAMLRAYRAALYRLAFSITGNDADAHEVIQDTILYYLPHGYLKFPDEVKQAFGWFCVGLRARAIDRVRKRELHGEISFESCTDILDASGQRSIAEDDPIPHQFRMDIQGAVSESDEDLAILQYDVRKALSRLSVRDRLIAEGAFAWGLTQEENAQFLGVHQTRVGKMLQRIVSQLRDLLREYGAS